MSLTFNVPQDDIAEEIETLDLKVVSGSIESELSIIIYDTPPFEPLAEEVVVVPCDESAEVCVDLNQDENFEYPPVSYQWTINGVDFGEDSCVTYQSLTSSLIEVYLEDGCGRTAYLQTLFEVPYMPLDLTMPNDTLLCNGASAVIDLEIEGGQPPYQIQWDDFNDEEASHVVDPEVSTNYEVVVIDNCDYSEVESTQVNVQTVQANILTRNLGNDIYEFDAVVNPAEPFPGRISTCGILGTTISPLRNHPLTNTMDFPNTRQPSMSPQTLVVPMWRSRTFMAMSSFTFPRRSRLTTTD